MNKSLLQLRSDGSRLWGGREGGTNTPFLCRSLQDYLEYIPLLWVSRWQKQINALALKRGLEGKEISISGLWIKAVSKCKFTFPLSNHYVFTSISTQWITEMFCLETLMVGVGSQQSTHSNGSRREVPEEPIKRRLDFSRTAITPAHHCPWNYQIQKICRKITISGTEEGSDLAGQGTHIYICAGMAYANKDNEKKPLIKQKICSLTHTCSQLPSRTK